MQIGGLGISEPTKKGKAPEIQRTAKQSVRKAMTDGFVEQIKEMAKKDAEKGICMDKEYLQLRDARMKKYISPDRSGPMTQVNSAMKALAQEQKRIEVYLERLFGNCSAKVEGDSIGQTAEIYSSEGEVIASYNSFGGGWTVIPTKAESSFIDESGDIYMQAFRAARAEMKSGSQTTASGSEAGIDLRA